MAEEDGAPAAGGFHKGRECIEPLSLACATVWLDLLLNAVSRTSEVFRSPEQPGFSRLAVAACAARFLVIGLDRLRDPGMYKGSPQLLDYSSTKGAITAFTRSYAKNAIKKGIRVNGVAPGPIWTPLNPFGGQKPEDIPEFGKDTPMGRPGQPNEVAPSFLFLACEDSSYMSGQVLHPNGGTIVNG